MVLSLSMLLGAASPARVEIRDAVRYTRRDVRVPGPPRRVVPYQRIALIEEHPHDPVKLHQLAYARRLERAQAAGTALAMVQLGQWCRQWRLSELAGQAFDAAIAIDPDNRDARNALGFVGRDEQWIQARQVFEEKLTALDRSSYQAYLDLAAWCRQHNLLHREIQLLLEVTDRTRPEYRSQNKAPWRLTALHQLGQLVRHRPQNIPMRPPFAGRWLAKLDRTQHHQIVGQYYAIDFQVVDERGRKYHRAGKRNEDWYTFGAEVYACAKGRVVFVVGHHEDMPPGTFGHHDNANRITIAYTGGELTLYGHLKQGSVVVRHGQIVKRGQLLAQVGNSGQSGVPHLHFNVGVSRHTTDNQWRSLTVPFFFDDFRLIQVRNIKCDIEVKRGRPQEGWIMQCP